MLGKASEAYAWADVGPGKLPIRSICPNSRFFP
jgi:hypothetical protein